MTDRPIKHGCDRAAAPRRFRGPVRKIVSGHIVVGLVLGLSGCIKPLFPKDQPRTQFETYDRLRNQEVPLEEPDVFGNPQPALRARLSQPK